MAHQKQEQTIEERVNTAKYLHRGPGSAGTVGMLTEKNDQLCDATFGAEVGEKRKALSSVSGIKGFFKDPFGIKRNEYRKAIAESGDKWEACALNSVDKSVGDFIKILNADTASRTAQKNLDKK